jgi:hypothetical protein
VRAGCIVVRAVAPSVPADRLSTRLGNHVAGCLTCQAELVRYIRLRRHLAGMANVVEAAPGYLAAEVITAVGRGSAPPRSGLLHPAGAAAAAGAVIAAAAGTVVVAWLRRARAAAPV